MTTARLSAPRRAARRLWRLTRGELGFAWRYGILPLYGLLTVIYLLLLSTTPALARPAAGGVTILTDPAAMGLFFMGAMVLLEKSQQVHCALAASPVRPAEYIAAKTIALLVPGLLVALIVGSYARLSLGGLLLSVTLASVLFTLLGLIVACRSQSLNQFLLLSIPVELITFIPALYYWFGAWRSPLWLINPGVAAMALLENANPLWPLAVLSLVAWDALIFLLCRREVARYFARLGGGTL